MVYLAGVTMQGHEGQPAAEPSRYPPPQWGEGVEQAHDWVTGENLTPQSVATLAEPFLRGTKRIRTDDAGVGLGLAIVKSIAEAHDGTLTFNPRSAGGLRVTVRLPAAPSKGDEFAAASRSLSQTTKREQR